MDKKYWRKAKKQFMLGFKTAIAAITIIVAIVLIIWIVLYFK